MEYTKGIYQKLALQGNPEDVTHAFFIGANANPQMVIGLSSASKRDELIACLRHKDGGVWQQIVKKSVAKCLRPSLAEATREKRIKNAEYKRLNPQRLDGEALPYQIKELPLSFRCVNRHEEKKERERLASQNRLQREKQWQDHQDYLTAVEKGVTVGDLLEIRD